MSQSYSVSIPLDDDGFLRRQCPHCNGQFKVHHGPTPDRPADYVDPPVYHCPVCGESAGLDQWWTEEQLEYAQGVAMGPILRDLSDELGRSMRGVRGIEFKPGRIDEPEPPPALQEPNDMVMVISPCHSWEPVKVPQIAVASVFCLLCGSEFAT
jgi:hypothetical protein